MKQTITLSQFRDGFSCRPENFSYEGLGVLFDYLEELEEDTGQEIEFDPIALCCDFSEGSLSDFARDFGEGEGDLLDYLEDNTTVLHVKGDVYIIQEF